jgi:hypothetical protein
VGGSRVVLGVHVTPSGIKKFLFVVSLEALPCSLLVDAAQIPVSGLVWCQWAFFPFFSLSFLRNYNLTLLIINISTSISVF